MSSPKAGPNVVPKAAKTARRPRKVAVVEVAAAAGTVDPVRAEPPSPAVIQPEPARPSPEPVAVHIPKEQIMATAFETTQETVQDTVKATVHQLNTTAEAALNSGKAAMEQVAAKSKEAVEASMKSLDEMTEMARGNVEAMMASARAATAGVEQITAHMVELSKKAMDESTGAMRAMASAKTPNELFQLQSDFTKTQFDAAVAEFSKLTEMMVKLSGEVMEPVQNQIAIASDKMKAALSR